MTLEELATKLGITRQQALAFCKKKYIPLKDGRLVFKSDPEFAFWAQNQTLADEWPK